MAWPLAVSMAMERIQHLVIGAGVSGLSYAGWLRETAAAAQRSPPDVLVLEKDGEPGGYCKTVQQDGFTWDYSGHFFHFKHPRIESWLRSRMPPGEEIRTVDKRSFVYFGDRRIDFPFQKNIHQLPQPDFIECLVDLNFKEEHTKVARDGSFEEMLHARFVRGIAERFLIPYNEKLYAIDLKRLDKDAMGRFFPHADTADIIRNMRAADNDSYNASFTYPRGGAIQYIRALLTAVDDSNISYNEPLRSIDLKHKVATTDHREIAFEYLVTSSPFPSLARCAGLPFEEGAFSCNKVLCLNLGFDKKGPDDVHWMYFPQRDLRFYRVGFYDNILGDPRMSLYVEIGAPSETVFNVEHERERVLADLRQSKIVTDQSLVSWHHVVLDPAYVHITQQSVREHHRLQQILHARGVYPVGRYGGWTYCSIEDNIVETRALAETLGAVA
ncbi:MAG: protoporphyrinogen/coproporphyrinogen oxidase [Myxococcota bacterium]